jgi:hypothetical protein
VLGYNVIMYDVSIKSDNQQSGNYEVKIDNDKCDKRVKLEKN